MKKIIAVACLLTSFSSFASILQCFITNDLNASITGDRDLEINEVLGIIKKEVNRSDSVRFKINNVLVTVPVDSIIYGNGSVSLFLRGMKVKILNDSSATLDLISSNGFMYTASKDSGQKNFGLKCELK